MKLFYFITIVLALACREKENAVPKDIGLNQNTRISRDKEIIMEFYSMNKKFFNYPVRYFPNKAGDQQAFLTEFKEYSELTYFEDSMIIRKYFGNDGSIGHPYIMLVVRLKNNPIVIPFDLHGMDKKLLSTELSKILSYAKQNGSYSKLQSACIIGDRIITDGLGLEKFNMYDTLLINKFYPSRLVEMKKYSDKKFIKQLVSKYSETRIRIKEVSDSIYFPQNFHLFGVRSPYAIYKDRYWLIYIVKYMEDRISVEIYNPLTYFHTYL